MRRTTLTGSISPMADVRESRCTPLITRGVKNIIVVDAENDPGYKFESYCGLREYLSERGIKLRIETIDNLSTARQEHKRGEKIFTAASVSEGTSFPNPGTPENL